MKTEKLCVLCGLPNDVKNVRCFPKSCAVMCDRCVEKLPNYEYNTIANLLHYGHIAKAKQVYNKWRNTK